MKNNGVMPETVIANIKTFISQQLSDYPSAKVVIGFPASGNDPTGYSLHCYGNSSFVSFTTKMKKLHQLMIQEFDNGSFNSNVTSVMLVNGFPEEVY